MGPEYWDELVASTVRGRRWIAAFDHVGGSDRFAQRMARQDADGLFILAGSIGSGDLPAPGLATWHLLNTGGVSMMDGIRRYEAALRDLPQDAVAAIDAFDPDATALVLRDVVAVDHPVAGRPSYGARPQAWVDALESKVTVDELWDAVGVARAPSHVVVNDGAALLAAAADIDGGMGTVWAGDNSRGWHGGASNVRWVRDGSTAQEAIEFFSGRSDRLRVMPFLDGIPCSIHGMVMESEQIALRPVELVILRRPSSSELVYAGAATAWDPQDRDRAEMRQAALATAVYLRDTFSYRGAFNLDGVMTADGWRPTELNARFSAGFGALSGGFGASMFHLHLTMVAGENFDYQGAQLERQLTTAADNTRTAGFGAPLPGLEVPEPLSAGIVLGADGPRFARSDEEGDATLSLGTMSSGGFLRFRINEPVVGESVAPLATQVLAMADAEWGTGLGPVEAAPDLR